MKSETTIKPINITPLELSGTVSYDNGYKLFIKPLKSNGVGTIPDGLDSLILYKNNEIEAFLVNNPQENKLDERNRGFWSKGEIDQENFVKYWDMAKNLASEKKNIDPRTREMYHVLNQYGNEARNRLLKGEEKKYELNIPFKRKI